MPPSEDSYNNSHVETEEELVINLGEDASLKLEEYIEIISTDDKRIKIIGEELANDTGRGIFTKICQGNTSPVDLSKSLDISLPLVNWHINRLLGAGLIQVEKTGTSSKNKKMNYYGPTKTVLVIVPPDQNVDGTHVRLRRIVKRVTSNITGIVSFVSGTLAIYWTNYALSNSGGIVIADPGAYVPSNLEISIVAMIGGTAIAVSAHVASKIIKKKKVAA